MEERQDMKDFIDSLNLKLKGEMRSGQYHYSIQFL